MDALTQGETLEEVQANLKEAIFLVLESEKELGPRKESFHEISVSHFLAV